jgi:FixJ family two-component response regulator
MPDSPIISIIDDDSFAREGIEALILSLGYRTVTFKSAADFLESGHLENTACLIADIHMPCLRGLDLQDRLAADGCPTPVIFITALAEERFRARAMATGAVGFLAKPFREESLIDCLDKALARPSSAKNRAPAA